MYLDDPRDHDRGGTEPAGMQQRRLADRDLGADVAALALAGWAFNLCQVVREQSSAEARPNGVAFWRLSWHHRTR